MIYGKIDVCIECNPLHGPRVAEIIQKLENGETVEKVQYVDEEVFPASVAAEVLPTREY